MSIYYTGCGDGQADPSCTDCPVKELGDIRSYFFVKNDFVFTDISSAAEWEAGIIAKDIFVVPHARGRKEDNENMQPGFGDSIETLDGYEFVLSLFDPNYADNCNFYNDIKRSKEWKIGWRTETQVHLSDSIATIVPKVPIAEDKKQSIIWNIIAKFTQEDHACPSDMPTGIFDRCLGVTP